MGERLLCKQEVIGSIPFTSTIQWSGIGDRISEWMAGRSAVGRGGWSGAVI